MNPSMNKKARLLPTQGSPMEGSGSNLLPYDDNDNESDDTYEFHFKVPSSQLTVFENEGNRLTDKNQNLFFDSRGIKRVAVCVHDCSIFSLIN